MTGQDVLPGTGKAPAFNPMLYGLYRKFVDHKTGQIEHGQWLRAIAEGANVGECRQCGHYLAPHRPHQITETRTDYEASCRACGWTCNAPGGRYARGSTRQSERKSGP